MDDAAVADRATAPATLEQAEQEYWCHAIDLIADMLKDLKPDELEARAVKMVATLRNAAYRLRSVPSRGELESNK